MGRNIRIGLRWKNIGISRRGQIPTEQRVQALHVEVPHTMKEADTNDLLQLYGTYHNTLYPNDARAHFVLSCQYIKIHRLLYNVTNLDHANNYSARASFHLKPGAFLI